MAAELDALRAENARLQLALLSAVHGNGAQRKAAHLRSKEAKLEAANNLTEARLRIERHTGAQIPQMQHAGLLARRGQPEKENLNRASFLSDYAITRDQSSLWQRMARATEEKTEEYFARARAKPPVSARRSSPTAPPRSARPGASGSVFFRV